METGQDGYNYVELEKANKQHGIKTELKQVLYVKCTSVS